MNVHVNVGPAVDIYSVDKLIPFCGDVPRCVTHIYIGRIYIMLVIAGCIAGYIICG